jgi:hypothetical protein
LRRFSQPQKRQQAVPALVLERASTLMMDHQAVSPAAKRMMMRSARPLRKLANRIRKKKRPTLSRRARNLHGILRRPRQVHLLALTLTDGTKLALSLFWFKTNFNSRKQIMYNKNKHAPRSLLTQSIILVSPLIDGSNRDSMTPFCWA